MLTKKIFVYILKNFALKMSKVTKIACSSPAQILILYNNIVTTGMANYLQKKRKKSKKTS